MSIFKMSPEMRAERDRAYERSRQILAEKRAKVEARHVNIDNLLTGKEFDMAISSTDIDGYERKRRYDKLSDAALWMDAYCDDVRNISFEKTQHNKNAVITMNFRYGSLRSTSKDVFALMCALSDYVSFISRDRFYEAVFTIYDIWWDEP